MSDVFAVVERTDYLGDELVGVCTNVPTAIAMARHHVENEDILNGETLVIRRPLDEVPSYPRPWDDIETIEWRSGK